MTSGVLSASESAQRKLTTLAADVVGYVKLAEADEERTLARLRTLRRDLIDPVISTHRGRVVKRTGDGVLAEFRSVVEAVRCAIEMQKGLVERNAGLPTDCRIVFRIGVHIGDVVEESDGDGRRREYRRAPRERRPAQRDQSSEDAYRQVKARLDLKVSDLGPKQLKNIAPSGCAKSFRLLPFSRRLGLVHALFDQDCRVPLIPIGPLLQDDHARRARSFVKFYPRPGIAA